MYTHPTAPLGIGQVLDGALKLASASFSRVWWYALVGALVGLPAAIYSLSNLGLQTQLASPFAMYKDPVYLALLLAGFIASYLFYAAVVLRQHRIATGDPDSSPFGEALGRLPALIVATISFLVIFMIGCVLLLIPGIFIFVALLLFSPLVVVEHAGPFDALGQSFRLVWGHWWRTFVLLVIAGCILFLAYVVVGFLVGIVTPLLSGKDALIASTLAIVLISVVLQIFIVPFSSSLALAIYYDLKLRREGGDLAARAAAL